MVMASFSWLGLGSSGSSTVDPGGGGGWGAFTPNVSYGGGSDWGGGWGSSFDMGGGGGWGGGFNDVVVGGGGGGGNWGAFTPNDDGFTNSEPPGGYAGTNPTYESITNLDPVTVTAKRPNIDTYNPVTVPYDPDVPWLDTVTVVGNYDWRSIEQPRDPNAKTLETVTVKPPETNELTDRQWRDWWADEQFKVFAPFTGGLASVYDGIKSWMRGDWRGVGLAIATALPVGKFGGLGYSSFYAFKSAHGLAGYADDGTKLVWHHIVEKRMEGRFGAHQIHNVDNLIKIDARTHDKISGYYNEIMPGTGGMRRRDVVAQMSYDEQYEFGMDVLRKFGVVQ